MRYSIKEVRGLLDNYRMLQEAKGVSGYGLYLLCVLADIDRALSVVPKQEYAVVVLYGIEGLPSRDAGLMLGCSHITVQNRFESAVSWITRYLNGEV